MKNVLKFNKFNFLKESYSDFNQFSQGGASPHSLGPGYGFAVDPSLSIYGNQDSPYTDPYSRTPMFVNALQGVLKNLNGSSLGTYGGIKYDQFLEDVDSYTNLKILRINKNANLNIDIFISFDFNGEEYFGVYKNFNWIEKSKLTSELYTDSEYRYIDNTYKLKLDNYFFQILSNWFKPSNIKYINLKNDLLVLDNMGNRFLLPEKSIIEVVDANVDKDSNSYIKILYKNKTYVINKTDYYYFNYWFDEYTDN